MNRAISLIESCCPSNVYNRQDNSSVLPSLFGADFGLWTNHIGTVGAVPILYLTKNAALQRNILANQFAGIHALLPLMFTNINFEVHHIFDKYIGMRE